MKSYKRNRCLTIYVALSLSIVTLLTSKIHAQLCVDYLRSNNKKSLTQVLRPKIRFDHLNSLLQSHSKPKILIGVGLNVKVFLEYRVVHRSQPKRWVVVKYMASEKAARQNSAMLKEYQHWKEKGFLSEFEVSQVIKEGKLWNMFHFYEGKELEFLAKWKRTGPSIPFDSGVRKIWQNYFDQLNQVKKTFEEAGYSVIGANQRGTFDFDFKTDLPSLTVLNKNSKPILQISPQNIWVTTKGKFIIIDAF